MPAGAGVRAGGGQEVAAAAGVGAQAFPVDNPFQTVCLPLSYGGKPTVNESILQGCVDTPSKLSGYP